MEKNIIAATLNGRMTVKRQVVRDMQVYDAVPYSNERCSLSRSAHTAAPQVPPLLSGIGESFYKMSLFFMPHVRIMAGDRISITQEGTVYSAIASSSFMYSSHGVCVVGVLSEESAKND